MSIQTQIVDVLTPSLGKFMAESIIKKQCDKIGIAPDQLSASTLPQLAEGVQLGIKIFVGSDRAAEISRKIASLGG